MCYIKAKEVLPAELIGLIQQYVEGEYLYIPKRENSKEAWGTKTKAKEELNLRNYHIYQAYIQGSSKEELAKKYFLSRKSIDRIILKERLR